MATIGDASLVQSRLVQLACEIGLRILRTSEFVLDCLSEDGLHSYTFILKPFSSAAHLDIQLCNLLEKGDQPDWSYVEAACMFANQQFDDVLIYPTDGRQVSVITEIPLLQPDLLTIASIHEHMAALHDRAKIFFEKLADIESDSHGSSIPATMVGAPILKQ